MVITVNTSLPIITPAVSPMKFLITTNLTADYLGLDIYVSDASNSNPTSGTFRNFKLDASSKEFDVQAIAQSFFTSDASAEPDLKRMDLFAHAFLSGIDTSLYIGNWYVFNGVNLGNYDVSSFMFSTSNAGFLNRWNAPITIHPTDKDPKLYFFHGIFESSTNRTPRYDVSTATFRITKNDISTSGYKTSQDSTPRIYSGKVDPSTLDTLVNNFTSVTKYTIDSSNNVTNVNQKVINVTPKDNRYTPKRFSWVDKNGCIDTFNFDLIDEVEIDITRALYNSSGKFKTFNQSFVKTFTAVSDWIEENESLALEDLWTSLSVMCDGEYVNVQDKSTPLLKQRPDRLINKVIKYTSALESKTQVQRN
jgi:hypothetical protein